MAVTLRILALRLLVFLLIFEFMGYSLIALSKPLLGWDVRKKRAILADQSEKIREMLYSDRHLCLAPHDSLGWYYRAGYRDDEGPLRDSISSQDLRGDKEYSPLPNQKLRVAAFGDSYTYGNFVSFDESWAARLEQSYPIELLNYGVGGYGMDQAYLRFQAEGVKLAPELVVIQFNSFMLPRAANVYMRFLDSRELPLFKPRYVLEGDSLELIPAPFHGVADYERILADPKLALTSRTNDFWYSPAIYSNPLYDYFASVRFVAFAASKLGFRYFDTDYAWDRYAFNERSSLFQLNVRLIEEFYKKAAEAAPEALVLILPIEKDLNQFLAGHPLTYEPLKHALAERGVKYLDGFDAFRPLLDPAQKDISSWFTSAHYSVAGNEIVAKWLGSQLSHFKHTPQV